MLLSIKQQDMIWYERTYVSFRCQTGADLLPLGKLEPQSQCRECLTAGSSVWCWWCRPRPAPAHTHTHKTRLLHNVLHPRILKAKITCLLRVKKVLIHNRQKQAADSTRSFSDAIKSVGGVEVKLESGAVIYGLLMKIQHCAKRKSFNYVFVLHKKQLL